MILSFRDATTRDIFEGNGVRYIPVEIQETARRKLRWLHKAKSLQDLRSPPGNHLELLIGDRRGQHSIRVNIRWRICFLWTPEGPQDVELVDYH